MTEIRNVRVVILDRDGVINQDSVNYIKSPEEWTPIPGSLEAISLLHKNGIKIYVATNQAGVGRDIFSLDALGAIHEKMKRLVIDAGGLISGIEFCPHRPNDHCPCRKPEPGMLNAILDLTGANPAHTAFVGDSLKDLRAGEAAGCRPVLVLSGNGAETHRLRPDLVSVYDDLFAFANEEISL